MRQRVFFDMLSKLRTRRTSRNRSLSLRSALIQLLLSAIVPLLVFSVAMVVRLDRDQRATFQRGAIDRTVALRTAIDTELRSSLTTLEALASSDDLDVGDLRSFHEEALRVFNTQRDWYTIHLASPAARQLVNIRESYGAALPLVRDRLSFEQVLRTKKAAVGNLSQNQHEGQLTFAVRVPVIRDGVVKYVLTANVKPQGMSRLFSAQRIPQRSIGVLLDGNRRFVTRTVEPEKSLGNLASADLRTALETASEGWFLDHTIEGRSLYTAFNRSEFSGWTVAIGIPANIVEAQFRRSLFEVVSFGLLFLALATGLAWFLSTRTTTSIKSLSHMAEEFGSGQNLIAADYLPSRIAELEVVREAFINAARLVHERSEERDRVETALREVSDRLELAQEAGGLGSFERNLLTGETRWSASQEKLYGIKPGGFGKTYEDFRRLVYPEDLAALEADVRTSTANMSPLVTEFRVLRPDGSMRWIATQGRVFRDEQGTPVRLIGVNIDITERKKAEEALKEADRRKDEFLAILGHELRNPLGVINTSIEIMRWETPADSTLAELREMMERQVGHMSRLLDDLLDISRINRGQIRLKREPCDLAQTVRQTAEDFRPRLEGTGLELVIDVPDKPLWVMGDHTRLVQIVENLLQNAHKFTEIGGRITVTVQLIESAATAVLSIHDTGIGMEPEMLACAFEPFSQSDRGLDRRGGGLGLGLALVKGLVMLHGGAVAAYSAGKGQGSEFVITLPLGGPPTSKEKLNELSAPSVQSCRVLIIEDNAMGARTMGMLLNRLGHIVETAQSGMEGIQTARLFRPDVVLCDIGLPGMDGYAVAQAMRQEPDLHDIFIIAITGYGQREDERRSIKAGFDVHLTKPVDLKTLQNLLKQWMLRKAGETANHPTWCTDQARAHSK